ncbi:MAG: N-acetylmuramoyl-L-alanine amidase [Methanobacterium sp.]|jgi:N-acetylmuramoyl-L-alanine amidase|uniref:peptidoglycan-binding domain-containing protein n=1 Tax=Methanobacterium sp. TaxID=2164 RepID=UPI0003C92E1C|nr:peptidoglycan-binding domain-containing protein [Methanobacterium sp.]MDI3550660.1 N-acetylmuramoyl-L-alanine amidase [Methanobacterium sp.]CDG65053.1 hypothetical protein MBMB1_0951 [Methanobacterium sp. MB1]
MVTSTVGATESSNNENTVVNNESIDDNLKIGMTGENVTELQTWLQVQGFYTGRIDGEFGIYTEQAVKAFQQYVGIKEDGIVGPISREAMDDLVNGELVVDDASSSTSSSYSDTGSSSDSYSSTGSTSTSKRAAYKTSKTYTGKSYSGKSYSSSYRSSGSGWSSGKGVGDCWQNSDVLYRQLTASGQKARIVQYANSYVSNHRSVEVWNGNRWVDYDYKGNGYSNRYYATPHSSSAKVIASS